MKVFLNFLFVLILSTSCVDKSESVDEIICPIQLTPTFPGDYEGLKKYIKENYNWQQRQLTVEGAVFVKFIILEDGSVAEPKVVKSLCKTCDAEAIRLVLQMPKWKPVIMNGKPAKESMTIPIRFGLTNPYQ